MAAQGSRQNGILMFRVEIHSPCSSHSFTDTTAVYGDVFTVVNTVLLLVCVYGLYRTKKRNIKKRNLKKSHIQKVVN